MKYEITVKSTPDQRYDGTVAALVRPVFAAAEVPITYEEGGAGGDEADNHYGFEGTAAQAAAITFGVALATAMPVQIIDRDDPRWNEPIEFPADAPAPLFVARDFTVLPGGGA